MSHASTPPDERPDEPAATDRPAVSAGGLAAAAGWLALGLAALSLIGQWTYPIELITHFWPQMALALLVGTAGAVWSGARRRAIAQGIGCLALVAAIAPGAPRPWAPDGEGSSDLTALFANVSRENTEYDRLIGAVRRVEPDIVVLAEIDAAWAAALDVLAEEYPHRVLEPRADNFGIALLSRIPLRSTSVEYLEPEAGLPSIVAGIDVGSAVWWIVATHPIPPFNRFAFDSRNAQLGALAELVRGLSGPTVVLGDLNAAPWSPYVRSLRSGSGLRSAAIGVRSLYTWPVGVPLLMIPLDHCLHSEPVSADAFSVLPSIGSDHYPIVCGLSLRDDA